MTQSTTQLIVTPLDSSDAAQLYALRHKAYHHALEFDWLDDQRLRWNEHDAQGLVLGVKTPDGELVSTARLCLFRRHAMAEAFCEYALPDDRDRYPTVVGGRAATDPAYHQKGLATLIRYAYLSALDRLNLRTVQRHSFTGSGRANTNTNTNKHPIASLMGVVYRGAPRVRSLERSGYELYPSQWCRDTEAKLRQTPLTIYLPAARFASAAQHCTPRLTGLSRKANICADLLDARLDNMLKRLN